MKKPPPIITELFRFISLRTPQLIDPVKREVGFIYHPDESSGHFLKGIKTEDLIAARAMIRERSSGFSPWKRYLDVRAVNEDLYDLSHWIVRNRTGLTHEEWKSKLKDIKPLSNKQLLACWDNLFYQCIAKDKPSVRQAAIQMIRAHNFLVRITASKMVSKAKLFSGRADKTESLPDGEKIRRYVKRLAKAKVVLPKVFSVEKNVTGTASYRGADSAFTKSLSRHTAAKRSKKKVADLSTVKDELAVLDIDSAKPAGKVATSRSVKLSTRTKDFLKKGKDVSIGKVTADLDRELEAEHRRLKDLTRADDTKSKRDYCYGILFEFADNGVAELDWTIMLPRPSISIGKAQFALWVNGSELGKVALDAIPAQEGMYLDVPLFRNKRLRINPGDEFVFAGRFITSTGERREFRHAGMATSELLYGCTDVVKDPGKDPVDTIPEEPKKDTTNDRVELFGVNRLGIGVFRRVEQEVCCYLPGEVSHIENILAREYKERHTRSLNSTETSTEDVTEFEVENQTDTATATRNEMQSEVAEVIDKANDIGGGAAAGVSASYGGSVTVSADGYLDIASSNAASVSDSQAKTYAEEVTASALERILQKTTAKRTSKILQEYEENNRHGFDNRGGEDHVTGIYRWVDILYTNRLVNYGTRLMVEFLIPEPARFYRAVLEQRALEKASVGVDDGMTMPESPAARFGLHNSDDLIGYNDPDAREAINYREIGDAYGVQIDAPPAEEWSTSKTLAGTSKKTKPFSKSAPMAIQSGYRCNKAQVSVWYRHDARNKEGTHWVVNVGGKRWEKNIQKAGNNDREYSQSNINLTLPSYVSTSVDISISGDRTLEYDVTVTLDCQIEPETYSDWQSDNYNKIMDAYNAMLLEYEGEQAAIDQAIEENMDEPRPMNPATYRSIEQREIKRVAIEMLMKPFVPVTGVPQGLDNYNELICPNEGTDVPQVIQDENWKRYSAHVKFFEQAFDWTLMAYLFYPYYWADKCDWGELMQTQASEDSTFEAFLQSGMARVVIPVRLGFESAVDLYMETGDIWNGGDLVQETDDDLYLSIEEELAEPLSTIESEWPTRVPTTLTIVQGDSVFLEDEGLPCCDKVEDNDVDTRLRGQSVRLKALETATTPEP